VAGLLIGWAPAEWLPVATVKSFSEPHSRLYGVSCERGVVELFGIYNFIYHSMTAKKKTETDNKQKTEIRLNINSHINHIKSFRSRLAQPKTELHTELSMSMNFVKNFCLRHTIKLDTNWILNMTRHSFTMPVDDVL